MREQEPDRLLTRAPVLVALERNAFRVSAACASIQASKDASSSSFIERPLIAEAVLNARWNDGSTLKFKSFNICEGGDICCSAELEGDSVALAEREPASAWDTINSLDRVISNSVRFCCFSRCSCCFS